MLLVLFVQLRNAAEHSRKHLHAVKLPQGSWRQEIKDRCGLSSIAVLQLRQFATAISGS